ERELLVQVRERRAATQVARVLAAAGQVDVLATLEPRLRARERRRVVLEALVLVNRPTTFEVVAAARLDLLLEVRVEPLGVDGEVAAEVFEQHLGDVEAPLRGGAGQRLVRARPQGV